ncbi:MAG: VWA domain-containing protein [Bacteroidales bacterium]|nr:VWA domain-containing protein [Bacteroidales bacterium]MBN2820151.1 VWA domain-containing protein [Bacteroidales bacterium]
MFRIQNTEILYLLLIIPVFYLGYYLYKINYRKRLRLFGNNELIEQLMPMKSVARQTLKFSFLMLSLALLIFSLSRPQFGSKLKEVKRKGIEIIIALDVSNSMMANDIAPNRLERAKQAISTLVKKLNNDQIGLIIFAGDAYTQLPITNDYVSAKLFLSNITTDAVSKQGTAIGKAIRHGMHSFTPNEETSKVIIIISDGENHEGDAVQAAQEAEEQGIKVFTIGMGSAEGSLIPLKNRSGFVTDRQGNPVTTRMNPEMLKQIAVAGGGDFYLASTSNVGLNKLYGELKKLDKAEIESQVYSEYDDQYSYFVLAALLLIILDLFILERKNKWLSNIKLFEQK